MLFKNFRKSFGKFRNYSLFLRTLITFGLSKPLSKYTLFFLSNGGISYRA